ncbi:anti-sigma factor domain-containing protein [Virgibacillus sp. C22-A2]|uniref:Anti-sigma factor domain-containing protein n=1 Tax=Virgibacillus tibetensis TaxID=3042313 RepID=A0ABU6KEL3_9BACI|nr:anti-sigma factor domain-containing protein [Virgibacillus sp. C22-A2]
MKKGIIMEQGRQYSIILTPDGAFKKVKPIRNASVGAEVSYVPLETNKGALFYYPWKKMNVPVRVISMACILFILFLPFYLTWGNSSTYAYVNIDINPSVELEIDDKLIVQSIRSLNEDATLIISQLKNIKQEKLEVVIEMIMNKSEETGLINYDKNMLIGVSYVTDKREKDSIIENLEDYFLMKESDWGIATFTVPLNVRKTAEESNKSMNEVMAEAINGNNNSVHEVEENNSVNDDEKAIINSFYNTENKNHPENELQLEEKPQNEVNYDTETAPVKNKGSLPKSDKKNSEIQDDYKKHPSELKGENGKVNSNPKSTQKSNNNKHNQKKTPTDSKVDQKSKGNYKGKDVKNNKDNKNNKNNGKGKDSRNNNNGNKGQN